MRKIILFQVMLTFSASALAQEMEPAWLNESEILTDIGFPQELLDQGLKGTVVIRAHIDTNGQYIEHMLLENPHPFLANLVENEIQRIRFSPAVSKNGKLEFWVNIPFQFHLVGRRPISMQHANWSFRQGRTKKAIKECKKMLKVCSHNLPLHLTLANFYAQKGQITLAQKQLNEAINAYEGLSDWYQELNIPFSDYYIRSGSRWLKRHFEMEGRSRLFELKELKELEKLLLTYEIKNNG